ncbi:hypothetical protein FKP32DRAFT_423346 [Trametes sanguinea]|nr:hypothetical protein FKP32DRAFT_423346 [Trametes sanguinea]
MCSCTGRCPSARYKYGAVSACSRIEPTTPPTLPLHSFKSLLRTRPPLPSCSSKRPQPPSCRTSGQIAPLIAVVSNRYTGLILRSQRLTM